MKLWLELQGTAGSEISEVCAEMAEVSARLKINVQVNANGIMLLCIPGDPADRIEACYHAEIQHRTSRHENQLDARSSGQR